MAKICIFRGIEAPAPAIRSLRVAHRRGGRLAAPRSSFGSARAGVRVKRNLARYGPTQRLRSAKAAKDIECQIAAASGCGHLARSRSSPAILTPPSSCGRNFSRSRDRPDPAGARLSEAVPQRTEKGPVARSATPQASAGGPPEAVCGGHFPSVFRRAPAAPWLLAVSSERLCAPPTFP
mgnify:CR=1 FL=1